MQALRGHRPGVGCLRCSRRGRRGCNPRSATRPRTPASPARPAASAGAGSGSCGDSRAAAGPADAPGQAELPWMAGPAGRAHAQRACELLCGLGDFVCPGGVRPAGLVGTGVEADTDAVGAGDDRLGSGDGSGDGDGVPPDCEADGAGRAGPGPEPPGGAEPWWPPMVGACGAAHRANGACGPPASATPTEARHAARAMPDPRPSRRNLRRRRPEGSANTGLDSTSRSVATGELFYPGIRLIVPCVIPSQPALINHVTDPVRETLYPRDEVYPGARMSLQARISDSNYSLKPGCPGNPPRFRNSCASSACPRQLGVALGL